MAKEVRKSVEITHPLTGKLVKVSAETAEKMRLAKEKARQKERKEPQVAPETKSGHALAEAKAKAQASAGVVHAGMEKAPSLHEQNIQYFSSELAAKLTEHGLDPSIDTSFFHDSLNPLGKDARRDILKAQCELVLARACKEGGLTWDKNKIIKYAPRLSEIVKPIIEVHCKPETEAYSLKMLQSAEKAYGVYLKELTTMADGVLISNTDGYRAFLKQIDFSGQPWYDLVQSSIAYQDFVQSKPARKVMEKGEFDPALTKRNNDCIRQIIRLSAKLEKPELTDAQLNEIGDCIVPLEKFSNTDGSLNILVVAYYDFFNNLGSAMKKFGFKDDGVFHHYSTNDCRKQIAEYFQGEISKKPGYKTIARSQRNPHTLIDIPLSTIENFDPRFCEALEFFLDLLGKKL